MADTREFSSSMSTPQSGSANLNITVEGDTTQYNPFGPDKSVEIPNRNAKLTIVVRGVDHDYQPGGTNTTVTIPSNVADVFINTPLASNDGVTQIDEGTTGQAKYLKCMELLGDGQLPIACGRYGPSGTHGSFGTLAYITNDCELCFYFQSLTVYDDNCLCKLTSAGVWYLMTM